MSHTKKNLRDVDDSAISYGLSDTQEARFARRDLGAQARQADTWRTPIRFVQD